MEWEIANYNTLKLIIQKLHIVLLYDNNKSQDFALFVL